MRDLHVRRASTAAKTGRFVSNAVKPRGAKWRIYYLDAMANAGKRPKRAMKGQTMATSTTPCSRRRYIQTLLASSALVSAGAADAQENATAASDARRESIEEVVVRGVARKFRPDEQTSATGLNMSLVETPQSVSVLTPEMMQTINANSPYEATDLVPGVQRSGYGFGLSQIVMRGVFNLSRRINSIELGNPVTSLQGYALERLEIVRGPATAIYGVTGSFGGEINSILKKPQQTRHMQFGVEFGSYDTQRYSFDITDSLTSDGNLSGRFVAKYDEYGLPLDINGEDFPNYESMALAAVNWDISPQTTLRFTHYYQHRNTDPWDGAALVQNADDTLSLPQVDPEQWYFSHPDQSRETLDIDFSLLELEHDFDNGWRSRSQLAYHTFEEDLEYFYPFGPFGAYSLADDEIYIYTYDVERSGEELTFNQSLGRDFELFGREAQVFAALEYREDREPDRFELLNSFFQGYAGIDWYTDGVYDGETPRFSDGSAFLPIQGDREDLFGVRQVLLTEDEDLKLSLQLLLRPTDRLQVLVGALYHDNDSVTTIPRNRGVDITPPEVTRVGFTESVYRFGATYDVVDDWGFVTDARVYYSYSEGFQPQTYTDADGNTVAAPQDMEQHEIGLKAEIFNGAVGASVALFDYEITNISVSSSFLGSFGGFGSTVLEGSQEATGLEFELVGEILPGWNVSANYAWMDAQILNPNNTESTPPRTTPEHSGTIMTTYEFLEGPLSGFRIGTTVKVSGDYSFIEGTSNVARFGSPLVDGGHERVDLHLSYAPRSGAFENVEMFFNWRNVFDEDIIVAKQGNPGYGVMFIDQQMVMGGLRYTFD
jgi:outer-membrane receptor for ferric coprogen and ferric-rhodotorulic acid